MSAERLLRALQRGARLVGLVLAPLAALPALAANPDTPDSPPRLRAEIAVVGETVTLGDLFTLTGEHAALAERPIARAPAPGRTASVAPDWLAQAAARQGLRWRPPAGLKRVRIARLGQTVAAGELAELIAAELSARHGGRWFVRLQDPRDRHAPADALLDPAVESLRYDARAARVTARVALSPGAPAQPVSARAEPGLEAWALVRDAPRGAILREGDLRAITAPASRAPQQPLTDPADALGRAARRALRAGAPLSLSDLERPPAVRRGEQATVFFQNGRLTLSLRARALEDAPAGALARFQNLDSARVLEARVLGPGRARVAAPEFAAALTLTPEERP